MCVIGTLVHYEPLILLRVTLVFFMTFFVLYITRVPFIQLICVLIVWCDILNSAQGLMKLRHVPSVLSTVSRPQPH